MGSCILAITPLLSLYTLDLRQLYPGHLIWGRFLVRLGLAVLLFYFTCICELGSQKRLATPHARQEF